MSLFKRADKKKEASKKDRILVRSGKDDWRSYPEPGSLLNMKLSPEEKKKES